MYPDYSNPYSPLNPNYDYFMSNIRGDVYTVIGLIIFTLVFCYYIKKKIDRI